MNYDNYERKIVECFAVELIGWPDDLLPICNPGQLGGRDQVQKLFVALTTNVCHWKKLSEQDRQRRIELNTECHARGEQVYKPSKKHTLQGTCQKRFLRRTPTKRKKVGERTRVRSV